MIRDHSDHGRSNEPMNPLWIRSHRFTWSSMIRVISDQWSWSRSSQRNALLRTSVRSWVRALPVNILQLNLVAYLIVIYRFIGPQFRQMVSKIIQDLEISSCNRFCHLYKSLPFTEKRPWSWYQGWLLRNGTRISVWNIPSRKTGLPFQVFRCSWKLSAGTIQNVLFHLLYPTGFSRNFL